MDSYFIFFIIITALVLSYFFVRTKLIKRVIIVAICMVLAGIATDYYNVWNEAMRFYIFLIPFTIPLFIARSPNVMKKLLLFMGITTALLIGDVMWQQYYQQAYEEAHPKTCSPTGIGIGKYGMFAPAVFDECPNEEFDSRPYPIISILLHIISISGGSALLVIGIIMSINDRKKNGRG